MRPTDPVPVTGPHKVIVLHCEVKGGDPRVEVRIDGVPVPGVQSVGIVENVEPDGIDLPLNPNAINRRHGGDYDLVLRVRAQDGTPAYALHGYGTVELATARLAYYTRDEDGALVPRDLLAHHLREVWENNGQIPDRPNGIVGSNEAWVLARLLDELGAALAPGEPLAGLARQAAAHLYARRTR